jgi:hypothetical protein
MRFGFRMISSPPQNGFVAERRFRRALAGSQILYSTLIAAGVQTDAVAPTYLRCGGMK